ncbi:MAG TPA: CheR family methyltransferase, partial [Candidatus Kapabacteria bacterium]|nr:CheR family methyltransferase [Candidatus Kapabacteria bacterium]
VFLAKLISGAINKQTIIEEITVPETWFFRDFETFNFLKERINKKNHTTNNEKISFLSAPCATGEEAYSIAIQLLEAGLIPDSFSITALDISEKSLQFAKEGIYSKSSFRIEIDFLKKYFTEDNGKLLISDRIKKLVQFRCENLISNDFLNSYDNFDYIFCKNVLIYLNESARQKVLFNLDKKLKKDGIIFSGHSEFMIFQNYGFQPINYPGAYAFTKKSNIPILKKIHDSSVNKTYNISQNKEIFKNSERQKQNLYGKSIIKKEISNKSADDEAINSLNITEKQEISNSISNNSIELIRNYANQSKFEEAMEICSEMINKNSINDEVYFLVGLIYEAQNKLDLSEQNYNKALYLNPNHYEAVVHLSLIYEKQGNIKQASLFKERAIKIHSKQMNNSPNLFPS